MGRLYTILLVMVNLALMPVAEARLTEPGAGSSLDRDPSRALRYGHCGRFVFNCDTHQVTIGGVSESLNCGRSTPTVPRGRIGRQGVGKGTYWPSLKGAEIVELGLGAVKIHTLPPKHGKMPVGYNSQGKHTGCLNVSPAMLKRIERCEGAPYEIIYNTKGTNIARHQSRQRQHYAQVTADSSSRPTGR